MQFICHSLDFARKDSREPFWFCTELTRSQRELQANGRTDLSVPPNSRPCNVWPPCFPTYKLLHNPVQAFEMAMVEFLRMGIS